MIKKILKISIIFLLMIVFNRITSNAAILATSKTVNSGENVSVTITSDIALSAYTVSATSYEGLTLVTSTGGTGAGTATISDAKAEGGMTSLATFTFKTPNVNSDQTYTVNFLASGMGDINLGSIPNDDCSAKITVKATQTQSESTPIPEPEPTPEPEQVDNVQTEEVKEEKKSNNANLSNLGITPNDFTGFKPGVTTYDVEVENDVTSVQVYANAQDSKSKISGTGTKELNEGQNALNVEVTAEDGTTKTYTINVNRKTAEESEDEDEEELTNVLGLSKLEIKDAELTPEFKTDVYEYTVKYIGEDTLLNITTELGKEDSKVEIVGNENLKEGENLVNILVTDATGENTVTYQLTVNKSLVEEQPLANQNQIGDQQGDNKTAIIIGVVAIIVLVIVIISLIIRARNKKLEEQYSIRYSDFDEDEDFDYSYEEENVEEFNNQILEGPTEKKKSKGKRFK